MKKLIFILLLCLPLTGKAQAITQVQIDSARSAFITWLQSNIPSSAMSLVVEIHNDPTSGPAQQFFLELIDLYDNAQSLVAYEKTGTDLEDAFKTVIEASASTRVMAGLAIIQADPNFTIRQVLKNLFFVKIPEFTKTNRLGSILNHKPG